MKAHEAGNRNGQTEELQSMDDPAFRQLLAAKDRDAWCELDRQCRSMLYHLAERATGNSHDADDVVNETFSLAHIGLSQGKKPRDMKQWLVNLAQDVLRTYTRSKERGPRVKGMSPRDMDGMPRDDGEPIDAMLAHEQVEIFRVTIAKLPHDERTAVAGKFEGKTNAEIGKELKINPDKVGILLWRVRNKLLEAQYVA